VTTLLGFISLAPFPLTKQTQLPKQNLFHPKKKKVLEKEQKIAHHFQRLLFVPNPKEKKKNFVYGPSCLGGFRFPSVINLSGSFNRPATGIIITVPV
jgi:hypothetical protein